MSLDLASLGLLDQCSSGSADKSGQTRIGLFANTHQCARLERSQVSCRLTKLV